MQRTIVLKSLRSEDTFITMQERKMSVSGNGNDIILGENILSLDAGITPTDVIYAVHTDGVTSQMSTIFNGTKTDEKLSLPVGSGNFIMLVIGSIPVILFTAPMQGRTAIYLSFPQTQMQPILLDKCVGGRYSYCAAEKEDGDIDVIYTNAFGCFVKNRFKWSVKQFAGESELLPAGSGFFYPDALYYRGMHIVCTTKAKEHNNLLYISPQGQTKLLYRGCPPDSRPLLYRIGEEVFVMWNQHGYILSCNCQSLKMQEENIKSYRGYEIFEIRMPQEKEEGFCRSSYGVKGSAPIQTVFTSSIFGASTQRQPLFEEFRRGQEVEEMAGISQVEPTREDIEMEKMKIKIKMLEDEIKSLKSEKNNIFDDKL